MLLRHELEIKGLSQEYGSRSHQRVPEKLAKSLSDVEAQCAPHVGKNPSAGGLHFKTIDTCAVLGCVTSALAM